MSERFNLLKPYLDRYKRRFSVLDIGSGIEPDQNIGQEIARNFNCVTTCIEKDWTREKFVQSPRTMVLKREVSMEDVARLKECEQFDAVLALNILHWFAESVELALTVFGMGDQVFIQIPSTDEHSAPNVRSMRTIFGLLEERHGSSMLIGNTSQFPSHPERELWMISNAAMAPHDLTRSNWDAHAMSCMTSVFPNPDKAIAIQRLKNSSYKEWIPGINLWTFCRLGGVYPDRDTVCDMLASFKLPDTPHGDITPHNFIFDGEALYLIDGGDGWEGHDDDKTALAKAVDKVSSELSK